MKPLLPLLLIVMSIASASHEAVSEDRVVLLLHGGAGLKRAEFSPEREQHVRHVLKEALQAGHAVLAKGGSSLEAVQAAIVVLEDAPEFNAGRGSVLNADGVVEMDASLMEGATRKAGAVAAVKTVRNPIRLAHLVMTVTPHVLLMGDGAEALAREHGLRFEEAEWFITPEQKARLERARQAKKFGVSLPGDDGSLKIGTVGAVALDRDGHLAAGTSTGGLVNKRAGRVGDTPIIGAGTYAEDGVCAVSCTGHGEFFIRNVVAYEVAARMKHAGADLLIATREVIHGQLKTQGGSGGLIALDSRGRMSATFNTEGMPHAWITDSGEIHVGVFEQR